MNPRRLLLLCIAGALLAAMSPHREARAEPAMGLGLFGSLASHSSEPTAPQFSGTSYDSAGIGGGVDFQLPLGDLFSVNPFFMLSIEDSNELVGDSAVDNSILGVQLRVWPAGGLYAGVHAGIYRQSISRSDQDNNVQSTSGSGFGFGVAAGYEVDLNPEALLIFGIQYDSASDVGVFSDTDVDVTGVRAHAGVRIRLGDTGGA